MKKLHLVPRSCALAGVLLAVVACKTAETPAAEPASTETKGSAPTVTSPEAAPGKAPVPEASTAKESATIGKPAPAFTLTDLDGKQVSLADQRGKLVVLEWFNPGCPFVKAAHTKGSLIDTAKKLGEKGVVYLAINSGAPGKQGHGVPANQEAKQKFALNHPILLDESGDVGRLYGATNTPQVFLIDAEGTLRYRGAIDNSKDGEGQDPEGGTLVNYLTQAVDEVMSQKPVSTPETKPYGCSVKYAS